MNDRTYKEKMGDLLSDTNTYECLKKDPTATYKRKLITIITTWQKNKPIPRWLKDKIYPTSEEIPKMYGTPKIHKASMPLRPIVASIGSITYQAAKVLAQILGPLVGKSKHHIRNSGDFAEKIKDLEVPPGRKLISYDVSALFTSIPVPDAIKAIQAALDEYDFSN